MNTSTANTSKKVADGSHFTAATTYEVAYGFSISIYIYIYIYIYISHWPILHVTLSVWSVCRSHNLIVKLCEIAANYKSYVIRLFVGPVKDLCLASATNKTYEQSRRWCQRQEQVRTGTATNQWKKLSHTYKYAAHADEDSRKEEQVSFRKSATKLVSLLRPIKRTLELFYII